MERIWAIGVLKGSNSVAFGFDEGLAVVKIGEAPTYCVTVGGKRRRAQARGVDVQEQI
jgi:coatomer subunit beta'